MMMFSVTKAMNISGHPLATFCGRVIDVEACIYLCMASYAPVFIHEKQRQFMVI